MLGKDRSIAVPALAVYLFLLVLRPLLLLSVLARRSSSSAAVAAPGVTADSALGFDPRP